jgi:hypothetical protein
LFDNPEERFRMVVATITAVDHRHPGGYVDTGQPHAQSIR